MEKKHGKLKTVGLVLGVLALMVLIVFLVGRSFGFFQYMKKGEVINIVNITGLSVDIDSSTEQALNLANAYPMSDSDGLNTDPFVFTLTNEVSEAIDYRLAIGNDTDKQASCYVDQAETIPCTLLPYQYIKYSYSINNGSYSTPANIPVTGMIYSGSINPNVSTTISLKIWIDSTAPNSIQGNTFFGQLIIMGEPRVK